MTDPGRQIGLLREGIENGERGRDAADRDLLLEYDRQL